jgi:hypothetical protein
MIDAPAVMPVFDEIKEKTGLDIHVSTMGINIQDSTQGSIKGYYGFHDKGAFRIDVNSEGVIVQINIWKSPGDLNHPDIKIDTSHDDIHSQIDSIIQSFQGKMIESSFLESEELLLITEGVKEDVSDFILENPNSLEMKNVDAFKRYLLWANSNGKKTISQVYFNNTFKSLKETPPSTSMAEELTVVEPTEEDIFVKDIMENEIFYKAAMYENILRRMSRGDPGIVSLFVYGSPGLGKTYLAKKILREEGVWESKVVYKSGSIAGFTGLLQLLWDNRKGKIIVLDDNDSILVGNIAAANILKACLNTDPDDRVVSYTRFKK